MTEHEDFTIEEQVAADRIGVSRDVMRTARRKFLTRREDWTKKGGRVMLTEAAVGKLLRHLEVVPPPDPGESGRTEDPQATLPHVDAEERSQADEGHDPSPAESGAQEPSSDPVPDELALTKWYPVIEELTAINRPCRNRHLVFAKHGDQVVRVKVRSNKNFRAGMTFKARHLQEDLWELEGRCPRFRGRW